MFKEEYGPMLTNSTTQLHYSNEAIHKAVPIIDKVYLLTL